jgi:hypothetical protein
MLTSWDTGLRFTLHRRLWILPEADATLGLVDSGATFRVVTRLETARGLRSTIVDDRRIVPGVEGAADITVSPDSAELSQDLTLVSTILFEGADAVVSPLAPQAIGSRLWEDRWTAKIEGGKARLPLELASFSKTFPGWAISDALFHVDIADYPELDFEQAVCVYLNTDHPDFVNAVEGGKSAETAFLWDGVIRRVISAGIGSAFESPVAWPEGSLGAQSGMWIASIFHGQPSSAVAALLKENSSLFEAKIQSWARIASRLTAGPRP